MRTSRETYTPKPQGNAPECDAPIEIVDRGRGPQLSNSRITVQDLVPYLNCTQEEILAILPILTEIELNVIRKYVAENYDAVMDQDRRIRERNESRTNPPEIEEIRKKGRAKILALKSRSASDMAQESGGDRSAG